MNTDRRTPDLLLEQYRLGELDPAAAARIEASMSAADRARLADMHADDARTLNSHPVRVVSVEVNRRVRASRPTRVWLAVPALAVAAAALLLFALPGRAPVSVGDAGLVAPTERAKGDPRLMVYRRVGEASEQLLDGDVARPGDTLQLAIWLDAPRHVAVLSIDGRGMVTRHLPADGPTGQIDVGKSTLDHAFALDDAPHYERFVLVTADEPIDVAVVASALEASADGPLTLPARWQSRTVSIRKEGGR